MMRGLKAWVDFVLSSPILNLIVTIENVILPPCSNCTDALKASIAAALRHSQGQAQRTYDRRTANEKKQLAVDMAREFAEEAANSCAEEAGSSHSSADCEFSQGDFVAVVEADSTLKSPKVLVGQVQRLVDRQAVLLWYKPAPGNVYKLHLDGTEWVEAIDSLVAVTLSPAKNKPGCFRLNSSLRSIHKQVVRE